MRVVVDTNIFLAGLLNADGGPAKIVHAFREGEFELVISPEVFDEYVRVIHLFDNAVPAHKSEELLELVELVFEKSVKVRAVAGGCRCSDADDEKFLSAALAGRADFLVTKNRKHFPPDTLSPTITFFTVSRIIFRSVPISVLQPELPESTHSALISVHQSWARPART